MSLPIGGEGELKIPASMADPNDVAVYLSCFDSDGFIDLKQLNGASPRNDGTVKAAQVAYRRLWKEEFGAVADSVPGECDPERIDPAVNAGIEQIFRYVEQGRTLIARLRKLVLDPTSEAKLLGETAAALENLDRDIEDIGHAAPVLGALVRFFVMEKQNMRGTDTLILASEMEDLYGALRRRAEKMRFYMSLFMGPVRQITPGATFSEMRA